MKQLKKQGDNATDAVALKKCRQNNPQGLKMLFDRYYKPLVIFASGYTRDTETAEDLVQQAFIKFWEQNHAFTIQTSVKSFLFQSVKNAAINHLKKNKTYQNMLLRYVADHPGVIPADLPDEAPSLEKTIEEAVSALPQKSRETLQLVIFQQMKYKEAAEYLNVSVNTVKTHLRHAYASLRQKLKHLLLAFIMIFF